MNSIVTANNNKVKTMSSRDIANLTNKQHGHIKRDIENMCEQLDLDVSTFGCTYFDSSNRAQKEYLLPRRECEILVTGYDVKRRAAVIDRWMELELATQPKLPATYIEALEKLIETEKEKIAIAEQRDHAIKTKAEISDKKTATAMATASVLSRKVKALENKLHDVGKYQSIIAAQLPQRIETETNSNAQTWRVLVKMCNEMNLPPKKVKDERYGEVNTYHVDVINRFIDEYL